MDAEKLRELLERVVLYADLSPSLEDEIREAIGWPSLEEAEWLL